MQPSYMEKLSGHELMIIAGRNGVKLEKTLKIDEICDIIGEYYGEIHDKSPFISIISDI